MVSIDNNNLIKKCDKNDLLSNNGTKVCQQKHVIVHLGSAVIGKPFDLIYLLIFCNIIF